MKTPLKTHFVSIKSADADDKEAVIRQRSLDGWRVAGAFPGAAVHETVFMLEREDVSAVPRIREGVMAAQNALLNGDGNVALRLLTDLLSWCGEPGDGTLGREKAA